MPTHSSEILYYVGFTKIDNIGPVRFQQLISYFGSAKNAWEAKFEDFLDLGWAHNFTEDIVKQRQSIDLESEMNKINRQKIKLITLEDNDYPQLLKEISDPPFLLYVKGKLVNHDQPFFSVVGTRKMTSYGEEATKKLVSDLSQAGLVIVSGLAFGIDACAHKSTLEAKGKTVAVLGSGLDKVSPATNFYLAQKIVESGGAIISEFPLETNAAPFTFPRRNRIISGLSLGVLVVEAGEKSGALITAAYAANQGRTVFAVPGSIFSPLSKGVNFLIQQGVKPVTCAEDILEEFEIERSLRKQKAKQIKPASNEEKIILEVLAGEERHVDSITRETNLDSSTINATLAMMEVKGMVKSLGNGRYRVVTEI